jgi:hypothetical protein
MDGLRYQLEDLGKKICHYVRSNGEDYDINKHIVFKKGRESDCVILSWDYKCPKPDMKDLETDPMVYEVSWNEHKLEESTRFLTNMTWWPALEVYLQNNFVAK